LKGRFDYFQGREAALILLLPTIAIRGQQIIVHRENYGWGMGFGWIFMIIFRALIMLGIIYLVRLFTNAGYSQSGCLYL
jgi:hypothetical protein